MDLSDEASNFVDKNQARAEDLIILCEGQVDQGIE